ncbi:hypothetical protein BD626DRAFT_392125 [Schizophyllum amplum]|uniref:Uncharacterized protein n=1 Tax=Schizophyllum amplum TaxID=97359 RepID=A0A550CZ72_9AGAR|nr:hypothetical protein BD626DRAFT_392125 [Auriculariopsis ampla]
MPSFLTAVSLSLSLLSFLGSAPLVSAGSSCVAFDINWNLLVFGLGGADYNAGTKDTWSSGSASEITADNRPPFDGDNVTCYLSQFYNAIYVLGADKSDASSVYIYDASAKSWSKQAVDAGSLDTSNFDAILDHDTNVFYAVSNAEFFSLDMSSLNAASSDKLAWNDVQSTGFDSSYKPVMALAQNHIHFLDVPDVDEGSAKIFVIHFSFMQPDAQSYGSFPKAHGQAGSIFLDAGVQEEFFFIPDDGSATYVINVESNSTKTMAGPPTVDTSAFYFASPDSIVQISSAGDVAYLPYDNSSDGSSASWATVQSLASFKPSSSASSGASGTGSATETATGGAASASGSSTDGNGASGRMAGAGSAAAALVVLALSALML